ncbi:MAG TPA: hypothetical protein DIW47_09060 [Bacteroidetes bacterium]|nr:hypothetical protein [Bacteroidota bacterium]
MKKSLLLILTLLCTSAVWAQFQIGQSISNYSGTNSLYFNASNVVDSRFKFYFNVTQSSLHMSNDYITWNGEFHPFAAVLYPTGIPIFQKIWKVQESNLDSAGYPVAKDAWLTENVNGNSKNALIQAEQRYLNFMFNLGPKSSLGFGARLRVVGQITDVSEPLARMTRYGFNDSAAPFLNGELNLNQLYTGNSININMFAFNEFAGTYGHVIIDDKETFVKAGITGKYFVPLYGMYIRNESIDVAVHGEDSFEFQNADIEYGYVGDRFYTDDASSKNPFELGRGFGVDLGVTYEYRPNYKSYRYKMNGKEKSDPSKNKYLFRVQAALNDLGSVNFKNDRYVRSYKLKSGAHVYIDEAFTDTLLVLEDKYAKEYGSLAVIDSIIDRTAGFQSRSKEFKMKLPSSFNVSVDYNIYKGFYANFVWIQSLRGKQVNGLRGFSLLAVTPRFESRWFDVSIPLQLTQNYRKLRVGMYLRTGPFWIGSDNFPALFTKDNINGADIYIGLSVPLHRKKEKDKDKDGVSNKYDKCRKVPGVWEFKGCPDTDGDGVEDKNDHCVNDSGKVVFNGCPDRDDDSVIDSLDKCPDIPGLPALAGCPDTDGDGIIDEKDSCPEQAGPIETNGCPDRDKDGILDHMDECPDVFGLAELNGCPDRDGDGISDNLDKCPDVPGIVRFSGCPDTDGDGVPDHVDLCPMEIGTVENNGCPKVVEKIDILEIPEEEQEILKVAFDNLEFAIGSAEISSGSFASLDQLVELMNKRPEYRIYIAGHTDNTGNAKKNEQLSLDRANAVRDYLAAKGINPTRIKTEGFGASRPVDTNDSPEGRQKNRRVEFRVIK